MLLLLYTIARKLEFTFEQYVLNRAHMASSLAPMNRYRLIPMGSFSRIEKTTGDKATYELYGSGDLHLGRLFHNRRFDLAMVAFLDCLKQLMDYIKSQDSGVDFPHQ
jgi:beclin 1